MCNLLISIFFSPETAVFSDKGCVRGQPGHLQETPVPNQPLPQRDGETDRGELTLHPVM